MHQNHNCIFLLQIYKEDLLETIKKYSPAIGFLIRFFIVYVLLTGIYNFYLSYYEAKPDMITAIVARQSKSVMESINYESSTLVNEGEDFVRFLVRGKPMGIIVEGCNSVSVIILFLSFVIAFKGTLIKTIVFILAGAVVIYLTNLFRIVILLIGFYEFPEYKDFLHTIIFPLIIYGMVFVMWMVWVTKFADK